jgi:hypothetical protein
MRIRTILAAAALAGVATLTLAGSAFAVDRDCRDFASHADAQAALDSAPGDPEGLDPDGDGKACEGQFVDDVVADPGTPGDSSGNSSGEPGDRSNDSGNSRDDSDDGGDDGGEDGGEDASVDDGPAPVGGVATGGGGSSAGPGVAAPIATAGASVLLIGLLVAADRHSGRPRD